MTGPGPGVTFVIMAGGRGERLWPLVREDRPKVCLSPDGVKTLLEHTIGRLRPVWPGAEWLIVTTREQARPVQACLRRARWPVRSASGARVLVEPETKNTAACITLAAAAVATKDPRRILVVVPADHWVLGLGAFSRTLRKAILTAWMHDRMVTVGIRPTHAQLGLGYLCGGAVLHGGRRPRVLHLARFVEKPSRALAARLVRRRGTYWNSGMLVGAADTVLRCVAERLPAHARRLVPLAGRIGTTRFAREARRVYRGLSPVSFDYGVMERLRDGLMVEGRFGWADLGSWDVWARVSGGSASSVSVDSQNVTVISQERHLVATVGVRNLIVVHTPTVTLICAPGKTQAIRHAVRRVAADPRLAAYR